MYTLSVLVLILVSSVVVVVVVIAVVAVAVAVVVVAVAVAVLILILVLVLVVSLLYYKSKYLTHCREVIYLLHTLNIVVTQPYSGFDVITRFLIVDSRRRRVS